jgi:hypothetical protein
MPEVFKQPGAHAHHQGVLALLGLGQFLVQQVLAGEIVSQALQALDQLAGLGQAEPAVHQAQQLGLAGPRRRLRKAPPGLLRI